MVVPWVSGSAPTPGVRARNGGLNGGLTRGEVPPEVIDLGVNDEGCQGPEEKEDRSPRRGQEPGLQSRVRQSYLPFTLDLLTAAGFEAPWAASAAACSLSSLD